VQILAFDDMEVLDYAGPYEVFNVAAELSSPSVFDVHSVGVGASPAGRGGFRVVPDFVLDDCPVADIVVVPGGVGTRRIMSDQRVLRWLQARADRAELVLTVCTGALVAAAAGLLDGLDATTHHAAFDELASAAPDTHVVRGARYVRSSDRIRTSAGVSAGVDLALEVVAEIGGESLREAVQAEMEWMWERS
jgi:transcriptional regulator GlxA family with amidase domain